MSKLLKAGSLGLLSLFVGCGPVAPEPPAECELVEFCDGTAGIYRVGALSPDACVETREPFTCDE